MYNEERKQQFLDSLAAEGYNGTYIRDYQNLFNRIEKYELENKCDISNFTIEQIMKMYDSFKIKDSSLNQYNNKLMRYSSAKSFLEAREKIAARIKDSSMSNNKKSENKKLITYVQLNEFVAGLQNPGDKFLILGAFYGIRGKNYVELSHSSMEDCDEATNSFWLAGYNDEQEVIQKKRRFYATPELFEIAKEASKSTAYVTETKGKVRQVRNLIPDGERILKVSYRPEVSRSVDRIVNKQTILNRYSLITRNSSLDIITPTDLYWSGIAYHVMRIAVEHGEKELDLKKIIKTESFEKVKEQYNIQTENRSILMQLKWYL